MHAETWGCWPDQKPGVIQGAEGPCWGSFATSAGTLLPSDLPAALHNTPGHFRQLINKQTNKLTNEQIKSPIQNYLLNSVRVGYLLTEIVKEMTVLVVLLEDLKG